MTNNLWIFDFISSIGATATLISVVWAISKYAFKTKKDKQDNLKSNILRMRSLINKLSNLLVEPLFAAIGESVANELKKMFDNEEISKVTEFMKSDDINNHNYKMVAVYNGLKQCDETSQIQELIDEIFGCLAEIKVVAPQLGRLFDRLLIYIINPARRCVSTDIISRAIKSTLDGEENSMWIRCINDATTTDNKELYFKEIAVFIIGVLRVPLKGNRFGKETLLLSKKIISLISEEFEIISQNTMNKIWKNEKNPTKIDSDDSVQPVIEAVEIIKQYKFFINEQKLEKCIENKGRIIQLMKDD